METENKLIQEEYEQVKRVNREAFEIVKEFLTMVDKLNFYKLKPIIQMMYRRSKRTFEKMKIIVDWTKQETIEKHKDSANIIRYYYDDVYSCIKNPVQEYKKEWKIYTKKMLGKIRNPNERKEFLKIRTKMRNKLDALEKQNKLE